MMKEADELYGPIKAEFIKREELCKQNKAKVDTETETMFETVTVSLNALNDKVVAQIKISGAPFCLSFCFFFHDTVLA